MELCLLGFQKEGFHPGSHWNEEVIHIFSHPFWSLWITVALFQLVIYKEKMVP